MGGGRIFAHVYFGGFRQQPADLANAASMV